MKSKHSNGHATTPKRSNVAYGMICAKTGVHKVMRDRRQRRMKDARQIKRDLQTDC